MKASSSNKANATITLSDETGGLIWVLAQTRARPFLAALFCLLLSFTIYWRTLAPTVYTFDSGEFATGAYSLGIIHSTGYPLYLLVSRLFTLLPVGDIAYRVNLESAVWGAVTIALLFAIGYQLTGQATLSAGAAMFFAFSHYYWPEAVIAETYTLNTVLVCTLILLLIRSPGVPRARVAAVAGLVFGLALSNHMSAILMLPALAYWGWLYLRGTRQALTAFLLFGSFTLVGLLFYLYLPIRFAADPPLNYAKTYFGVDLTTLQGLWSWMSGEMFRSYVMGYDAIAIWPEVGKYVTWLWANFLGAGVLLGIIGAAYLFRKSRKLFGFLMLLYLAYTLFFISYRVVNKDTMFAVSYLIWTIWIALGGLAVGEWIVSQPHVEANAGWVARRTWVAPAGLGLLAIVSLMVNYAWADQSQNRLASDLSREVMDQVAPSAFVMTEWTFATPLEYQQVVDGKRPDVTIFDRGLYGLALWNRLKREGYSDSAAAYQIELQLTDLVRQTLVRRPVYATEYDSSLAAVFTFVPKGRYYQIVLP